MSRQDEEITRRVAELAEPVLDEQGLELVEVQYRREKDGIVLRLFIDRVPDAGVADSGSGVTIDDCTEVSREVGRILDVEDPAPGSYTLEVSSPGLDRPLTRPQDFERFRGRLVKVKARLPEGRRTYTGRLQGLADGLIKMESEGRDLEIEYERAEKVRLVPEIDFGGR